MLVISGSSTIGRIVRAARPGSPWLRLTLPPRLADIAVAAGARRAGAPDAMRVPASHVTADEPRLPEADQPDAIARLSDRLSELSRAVDAIRVAMSRQSQADVWEAAQLHLAERNVTATAVRRKDQPITLYPTT